MKRLLTITSVALLTAAMLPAAAAAQDELAELRPTPARLALQQRASELIARPDYDQAATTLVD